MLLPPRNRMGGRLIELAVTRDEIETDPTGFASTSFLLTELEELRENLVSDPDLFQAFLEAAVECAWLGHRLGGDEFYEGLDRWIHGPPEDPSD